MAIAHLRIRKILMGENHFGRIATLEELDRDERFAAIQIFGHLLWGRHLLPGPCEYKLFRRLHFTKDPEAAVGEPLLRNRNLDHVTPAGAHVEFRIFWLLRRNIATHPLL